MKRRLTPTQIRYRELYEAGYTVGQIAFIFGKSPSTVSRTLKLTRNMLCPFSPTCQKCPLPDCAISDKYAYLLNDGSRGNRHKEELIK